MNFEIVKKSVDNKEVCSLMVRLSLSVDAFANMVRLGLLRLWLWQLHFYVHVHLLYGLLAYLVIISCSWLHLVQEMSFLTSSVVFHVTEWGSHGMDVD